MGRLSPRHNGEESVMPSMFSRQRWIVAGLVWFMLALACWSTSAFGAPSGPSAGSPPSAAMPAPAGSPTPQPSPTQSGQPPVVINILPGGSGGGAPQAPQDNSAPVLSITGYHTDPSPVQSGQPFTLSVTVTNTGSSCWNVLSASTTRVWSERW